MKKLFSLLFISVFIISFGIKSFSFDDATIYTDFSGTEFKTGGGISENTAIKIEITNNKKTDISGKLIYSFYNENKLLGIEMGDNINISKTESAVSITYMTEKAYEKANKLKIMLWNGKSIAPVSYSIISFEAKGAAGSLSQYKNFSEQPDDKLKEQMPAPFEANTDKMIQVESYDFDDFDFESYSDSKLNKFGPFEQSYCVGTWTAEKTCGIDNSACVKMEINENVSLTRFQVVYKTINAKPGDRFRFKLRVKGENLTENDKVRPYLEFSDDTNKIHGSTYGAKVNYQSANNGWTECFVESTIGNYAGENEKSEYYNIYLNMFLQGEGEKTVYIDNISLLKSSQIVAYNFDDFDFESYTNSKLNKFGPFEQSYCTGLWSVQESGGVNDSPCVKIEINEDVSSGRFQLVYKTSEVRPGDWVCLKFKLKGENLTDSDTARPYIEFADDTNRIHGSIYGERVNYNSANNGWTECFVLSSISEYKNDGESQYYQIYANAFFNGSGNKAVYVDDITVSKVVMDPMDSVLVTPNYKGLVYGDFGENDINVRINLNDYNGSYNYKNFTLVSRLTDADDKEYSVMKTNSPSKVTDVTFSSSVLPPGNGDYYLQCIVIDRLSGETIQKQEWTIRKRAEDYRPKIYVDEYNRYIKDGVAKIPIFHYAHGNIYEEYVDVIAGTAVDAFTVAGSYHQSYNTPRMQRLRQSMTEKEVGGLLECCGYVYSHLYTGIPKTNVKKQSDIRSLLTVMLNNFKDDPRIWAYRTFDEQNAVYYGEELRWQNDIMASVDIDHPTMGVTDKLFAERPGLYAKTTDILGVDPYFCTGRDNQDLSKVGEMVRSAKELNPNKPVFAIVQGFWNYTGGDLRGPTEEEYRNMVWQALCEGITALDSFSYTDIKNKPWSGKTCEEIWSEQLKVMGEVKEFENVLLSVLPRPYFELTSSDYVKVTSRRYDGKSYFFIVNSSNMTEEITLKAGDITSATEYYSGAKIAIDNDNEFSLTMAPYGVSIIEAEESDYLSPHAELIRFGVSSGDKSVAVADPDKEVPVIRLASETKELDYRVTASEFAQIYINGSKSSSCGKINVESLDSIKIRIVSEDGKHSEERTYALLRQ